MVADRGETIIIFSLHLKVACRDEHQLKEREMREGRRN
jgi:hypothetical protein